jgi:hypothetical protein
MRDFLPAILGEALFRPHLSYPLESLDISGQWLVSSADASPNEGLYTGIVSRGSPMSRLIFVLILYDVGLSACTLNVVGIEFDVMVERASGGL